MNRGLACALLLSASLAAACSVKPKYQYKEPVQRLRLTLLPLSEPVPGKPVEIDAKLTDIESLSVIRDENLEVKHTRKFHMLAIDTTLTDYRHIHPEATQIPGVYHFRFTPHKPGSYRFWADVTLATAHKQEYAFTDSGPRKPGAIDKTPSLESTTGGYRFTLRFDNPPAAGAETMATLSITDARGSKVAALQPLMGAYGHIVGFHEDYRTIIHTHPLGSEPTSDKERGSAPLTFHFIAPKPGFVKLFAQVVIDNREIYAPFGVVVAEPK